MVLVLSLLMNLALSSYVLIRTVHTQHLNCKYIPNGFLRRKKKFQVSKISTNCLEKGTFHVVICGREYYLPSYYYNSEFVKETKKNLGNEGLKFFSP